MKTWGKGLWALFLAIIAVILSIIYVTFHAYYAIGYLKFYLIWFVLLFGFIILKTYLERDTKKLHIHHYFWSSVIVTFLCYQSVFITLVAGFFNGVMLEGGADWGFDPIWLPKDSESNLMQSKPKHEINEELMHTWKHSTIHRNAWIMRKSHQDSIRRSNGEASNY